LRMGLGAGKLAFRGSFRGVIWVIFLRKTAKNFFCRNGLFPQPVVVEFRVLPN